MEFPTKGSHIIVELNGCSSQLISDRRFLEDSLLKAIEIANAECLQSNFQVYPSGGISAVLLLKQAHCNLHTWPEEEYVALDFYTFGNKNIPLEAVNYFAKSLKAESLYISHLSRGIFSLEGNHRQHVIFHTELQNTEELQPIKVLTEAN